MPNITNSSGASMVWQGVEIQPGETKFIQIENATAPSWQTAKPVGWQPIETAPKDGTDILITGHKYNNPEKGRWMASAHWSTAGGWHDDEVEDEYSELYDPTHWMPLPAAPKEQP